MNLVIDIKFLCENHGYYGFARKKFITEVLPYEGLKVIDTAWVNFKKVVSVTVNFQTELIQVSLEDEVFFDKSMIPQIKDKYKNEGWEIK